MYPCALGVCKKHPLCYQAPCAAEHWHNQFARNRANNFVNETTAKRAINTENAPITGKSG